MISLPTKFERDTLENYLSINPFIIIGWDYVTSLPKANAVHISTFKEQIKSTVDPTGRATHIYDQNLKISTIKESIDFETRKFKINNVSLSISNFGNFSETISKFDVMNETVAIFWKTPSAEHLDDCLLIYEAQIVRYDHDEKTIKLQLEDKTLYKIDKDVPIANLGTSQRVYRDKDRNKYIPIAYGNIPRAPAIPYAMTSAEVELANADNYEGGFEGYYIIADDVMDSLGTGRSIVGKTSGGPDGLLVNRGGDSGYWNVKAVMTDNVLDFDYPSSLDQVWEHPSVADSYAYFIPHWKWENGSYPGSPAQDNKIECYKRVYPLSMTKRYGYLDPDTPGFNDMGMSNPQYAVDKGNSDLEAQAFGIDPNSSYCEFPDIDRDSWVEEESPYPTIDVSNDIRTELEGSEYGNFLIYDKIEWLDVARSEYNWFYGIGYEDRYPIPGGYDWWNHELKPPPQRYHEIDQPAGVSDEDWWRKHCKWKVEWCNFDYDAEVYGTYSYPQNFYVGLVCGGYFPSSWNFDADRYLYDFAEDGFYGHSNSSSYDHDGKCYFLESPINYDVGNGVLADSYIKKFYPRVFDFLPQKSTVIKYIVDQEISDEYDGPTGSLSVPLTSGACLVQLPNTTKIREAVEAFTGLTMGDPDGNKDRYSFITYCDGLMNMDDSSVNSGKYHDQHIGAREPDDGNIDGDKNYHRHPFLPYMPQILAARPYGQMVYFFGYDCQPVPSNFPGAGSEYCPTKFIAVTFNGEFEVEKWNWHSSYDDGYYQNLQTITHSLALYDIIDFSQLALASVHNATFTHSLSNIGHGQEGGGENFHAFENRDKTYTSQDYWWNGVEINSPDVGDPGGECSEYSKLSPKLGGGTDRWHMFYTKNSELISGLGLAPGVMMSTYNNWERYEEDAIVGWEDGSAATPLLGGLDWSTGGNFNYYLPPAAGFYNFPPDETVDFCFELPQVGYDDLVDGSLRVHQRYKFSVATDIEALEAVDDAGEVDLSAHRLETRFLAGTAGGDQKTSSSKTYLSGTSMILYYQGQEDGSYEPYWYDNITGNEIISEWNTDDLMDGSGGGGSHVMWDNAGQFENYTMEVKWKGDFQDSDVALPFRIRLYNFYLLMSGCFDKLKGSQFFIENYQGRRHAGSGSPIEDPCNIIVDILHSELEYEGIVNSTEFNKATNNCLNWKLAFSVQNKINSKKLIEEICSNTPILPRFRSKNEFGFISLSNDYSSADVTKTIKGNDVIKFKFSKTKIEKVVSAVEVKYNYDYALKSYSNTTGWSNVKDFLGDGDLGYVGSNGKPGYSLNYYNLGGKRDLAGIELTTDDDTSKTIEAKYVVDYTTAKKLQKFYLMFNANQHIVLQTDLTLAYLGLEVGDIIYYDQLPGNITAYGLDYTKENFINGQTIYPYFIIQEITKKTDRVIVKSLQLHNLNNTFTPEKGDISRRGTSVWDEGNQPDDLDKLMLAEYLESKATSKYSMRQIGSMDINDTYSITHKDLSFWDEWLLDPGEYIPDGYIEPGEESGPADEV